MTVRRLGVNIDHIATLRQARGVTYPDPLEALSILTKLHVDQVTIHLREDRRHIIDRDLEVISKAAALPVNLELAVTDEMVGLAVKHKPHTVTFVPEKREEVTTEGGLDCVAQFSRIQKAIQTLTSEGVRCSLFIDANCDQVQASADLKAEGVEIHTGTYCNVIEDHYVKSGSYDYSQNSKVNDQVQKELSHISEACSKANQLGVKAFAGHGLHRFNLKPMTEITAIEEYNIGHAIIARSVFVGLTQAIKEIQDLLLP